MVYPLIESPSGTKVLLGRKKNGLGAGRIVGPGGKVEAGEGIAQAAIRELYEEVGLVAMTGGLEMVATISYPFLSRPHLSQRSFAFVLREFEGTVQDSDELSAQWWPVSALPLDDMWPDAKLWLPQALGGNFQSATITIGDDDDVVSVEWEMGGVGGPF